MRTSLSEIEHIERYLLGTLAPADALVFEARLITDDSLKVNVMLQKTVLEMVAYYHRKKAKENIRHVSDHIFASAEKSDFKDSIEQIFRQ
jgi:hypothetical protein